jgi:hypothetical protein
MFLFLNVKITIIPSIKEAIKMLGKNPGISGAGGGKYTNGTNPSGK